MKHLLLLLLIFFATSVKPNTYASTQTQYDRDYLQRSLARYPQEHKKADGTCETLLIFDIASITLDPVLMKYISEEFAKKIVELRPDFIAAAEARAWLFAPAIAQRFGIPMIPIRKKGKFPKGAPLLSQTYGMSYADEVTIEMIADENKFKGKTVVIIDDGMSSGGTTIGTIELLKQAGLQTIGILAVVRHHYRATMAAYAPYESMTTTLFDLGK